MKRLLRAAIIALGVLGACGQTSDANAPLCGYARGQTWDAVGDNIQGAASHEEAVASYIAAELGTPDITGNPVVEISEDEARDRTVLTENGTVVATFGVEQTDGGGFMVSWAEYCTEGDLGPFLAHSFDPQLAFSSQAPLGTAG